MTNIIKLSIFAGVIAVAFGVFAFVPAVSNFVDDSVLIPAASLAYTSGDGGTGCSGCGPDPSPEPGPGDPGPCYPYGCGPEPAPKCDSFTVSPSTLPYGGGKVTLTWRTTGVGGVHISSIGNEDPDGSRVVNVTTTSTWTLTATNTSGKDTCTAKVTVQPKPTPKPATCDFLTASPTTLPYGGGNVTLKWGTTNAKNVAISGLGPVAVDGSKTVKVTQTTTFRLLAVNPDKPATSDECVVKVTVQPKPTPKPATCDFLKTNKTTLPHGGGNIVLSWGTTNATSVSINQGVGNVAADGSVTVFVGATKTFTLTAKGTGGNDTCAVTVKVQPQKDAAICDFFKSSKTTLPKGGGNVTLSWGTTNATSVSINNGVGTVSADGSTVVNVTDDITYTLTAVGAGGNDTCFVSIKIEDDEDKPEPRCDFFTVSDSSVEEGDRVTLEWGTTNADKVSINQGIGEVSKNGSKRVTIDDDTTFILTVSNSEGEDSCRVSVEVEEEEDEDDDEPKPRCELTISDDQVKRGTKVTLEWETSNADEIVIEDDKGNEIFESDKKKYMDGEIDVIINRDTEFTLTAKGDGGKRECEVDVEVEDDITVFEQRDQPLVISLASVPYTGFEAGPALTFLFYALLTLWALFIAYVLVIKKGSILGFSLAGANKRAAENLTETDEYKKKLEALVQKYAHRPWM